MIVVWRECNGEWEVASGVLGLFGMTGKLLGIFWEGSDYFLGPSGVCMVVEIANKIYVERLCERLIDIDCAGLYSGHYRHKNARLVSW